ncbi:MAG: hypothetical protein ABIJ08_06550 [Nanoarchaeota archaeon]
MVKTSLIKKVDKESIEKIIFFTKNLPNEDFQFLKSEFDFNSNNVNYILGGHRNIGLVFNLNQKSDGLNFDWSPFINRVIIKNDIVNKLDNVFINKEYNKILLMTTKRLLKIDLDRLNEKIDLINTAIDRYNLKIEKERREIELKFD